jgi:hypothetical protein
LRASAHPVRLPRLRTEAPIGLPVLVQPAGFGVGRLCLSTLSFPEPQLPNA